MSRAAVLIGVDKTGNAPQLNDAASGAKRMKKWAEQQNMDTILLTDERGKKVSPDQIFAAIESIAKKGADQLIVYFAGHGVNIGYSERWLLSDAPGNSNAAVNLAGSAECARRLGIGHVVFFSDACRTAAEGIQAQGVAGSIVFPNVSPTGLEKAVDEFWATRLGDPAHEIKDPNQAASKYEALYTGVLLDALGGAAPEVIEPDPPDSIVRPWRLRVFLEEEVQRRIKARDLAALVIQEPDARITSDPKKAWVSRLRAVPGPRSASRPPGAGPLSPPGPDGGGDGGKRIQRPFVGVPQASANNLEFVTRSLLRSAVSDGAMLDEMIQRARTDTVRGSRAIAERIDRSTNPPGPDHFETECGFKVQGAQVAEAIAKRADARVLGDDLVRIDKVQPPGASVLIVLKSGNGAVVPAIPGFIGTLAIEDRNLTDVSYEPSAQTWRWNPFKQRATQIRTLRGIAASATRSGLFRLEEEKDALAVARQMQYAKGLDPTLAVYAAYAYLGLRRRDRIKEMSGYMRDDLGMRLFDIAMLTGELEGKMGRDASVLPFLPLLSQGWALLSAYRIELPPALKAIEPMLLPSVWTFFNRDGVKRLRSVFQSGEVI